ncbi:MAG: DUF6438 domain-containing protein [Nannocystaceae bacterium]
MPRAAADERGAARPSRRLRRRSGAAPRPRALAFSLALVLGSASAPLALSSGCATALQPLADPAPAEGPLLLLFERRGCYGFCPAYWLRVAEDGGILYYGEHFVAAVGPRRGQLDPAALAELRAAVDAAGFADLEARYTRPRYRDLPVIVTTYRGGDAAKSVVHHLGDVTAPAALLELEEAIDRIVGSEAWVGSDAERDRLSGA